MQRPFEDDASTACGSVELAGSTTDGSTAVV
jgi:hypothetical protein